MSQAIGKNRHIFNNVNVLPTLLNIDRCARGYYRSIKISEDPLGEATFSVIPQRGTLVGFIGTDLLDRN
jgi:hypothetical protein